MDKHIDVNEIITEVQEKRKAQMSEGTKVYSVHNFRASDIGGCDRALCYSIMNWQEKKRFNEDVVARLRRGKDVERIIKRDFLDMGIEIIEAQEIFEVKHPQTKELICRGAIDGKLQKGKVQFPLEIKTCTPNVYNQIETYEDLDKKSWLRKYKRQMQMYLYGHEKEQGIILFDDLQGHWKLIPVYLDLGECEYLLKRMERTWLLIKGGKYADRMKFDRQECGMCSFNHICLPDIESSMAELVDNADIEAMLEQRALCEVDKRKYDKLDKELKDIYKKGKSDNVIIGTNWQMIRTQRIENRLNTKAIPDDVKAQYREDTEKVIINFVDMRKVKDKTSKDGDNNE